MPAAWLVVREGLLLQLQDLIVGKMAGAQVGLYQGNYTPQFGDTLMTYLLMEANWPGYASQTVVSWSAPEIDAGNRAVTYSNVITWEVTGSTPNLAYGCFVYSASLELLWAELFDTPITPNVGIPISRVVRYNLRNQ